MLCRIPPHTHTQRERERERDTVQRDRDREIEIDRYRERERDLKHENGFELRLMIIIMCYTMLYYTINQLKLI